MEYYPLLLNPVPKEILWGGTKLRTRYNKAAPFEKIAESWELTVRQDGMNTIAGESPEKTLEAFLREQGTAVVSPTWDGGRFPLLIKFIDARDKLSIQVHPDNEYALTHENDLGKTEMWYVVEAGSGAQLVYGLKKGVSVGDFAAMIREKRTEDGLNCVDVHAGDCFFIPSGQVHAIGAGILIAEIQQSSNVTYRVYDYDRRQKDGTLRQLHVEKALDVIRVRNAEEIRRLQFTEEQQVRDAGLLADCAYFRVRKMTACSLPCRVFPQESFISLLCVAGTGELTCGGRKYPVRTGDSYFLPRGCREGQLDACSEDFTVLQTETKE